MRFQVSLVNGQHQPETQRQEEDEIEVFLPPAPCQVPKSWLHPSTLSHSPARSPLHTALSPVATGGSNSPLLLAPRAALPKP